jgi:hypothetical protein
VDIGPDIEGLEIGGTRGPGDDKQPNSTRADQGAMPGQGDAPAVATM